MNEKGILIMAMGHPNYGKMAMQLAVSLKNTCPEIPVALAYTDPAITHILRFNLSEYFAHLIPIPAEYYTRKGETEFIRAKLHMYDLSPFETTLLLDADIIAFPYNSFGKVFEELKDVDLAIQNRGYIDLISEYISPDEIYWADINAVKQMYRFQTGKYFKIHSEFVYFKKGVKNLKTFMDSQFIYDNLEVEVKTVFAGAIPDELPLSIAMIQNENYPHLPNYLPVYWEAIEKNRSGELHQLYQTHYGYSTGGSKSTHQMKERYNRLARWHCQQAGINNQVYYHIDKRAWAPERMNI